MDRCLSCGDPLILFGRRTASLLGLREGRLAREAVPVQKYFCKTCGKVQSGSVSSVSPEAVQAIVDGVLGQGTTRTAEILGCDRSKVEAVYGKWCASQQETLPRRLPDVIGIRARNVGGIDRLVVTDAVEETLVEILDGLGELRQWLSGRPGVPSLAVIDVDPVIAGILEEAFPGIQIAIAPAASIAAITRAASVSLRTARRRDAALGRNFREDPALLTVPDAALDAGQQEEIECWSATARGLRRITLDLLDALSGGTAEAVARVVAHCAAILGKAVPVGTLGKLLATWGSRMVAGAGDRWINRAYTASGALLDAMAGVRPGMRRHSRAFLLFSLPERELGRIVALATGPHGFAPPALPR